jgi:hypothetical protein
LKRLRSIVKKLRFIILAPSLDPVEVKSDLETLLEGDGETTNVAYIYYFEGSLARTAEILGMCPSRASSHIKEMFQILEGKSIQGSAVARRYRQYFRRMVKSASVLGVHCKKGDKRRMDSLVRGVSILGENRPRRRGENIYG